ncbi:MAG: hypothetical protein JW837_12035 [Sedimentisphaerales bacterium]|nr:hypothetical protein [Sedimentisphaerales bacterium]
MKSGILAFLVCLFTVSAFGDTIYLDANGTGDYPTIQAAINAAANGDEIVLGPGNYTGSGNRNIRYLGKAITVRSTNPYEQSVVDSTIIDGQASLSTGFIFNSGEGPDSVLSGLTIMGFLYDGPECYDWVCPIVSESSPTVSKCKIAYNKSYACNGTGILNSGNMVVIDCTFIGNLTEFTPVSGAIINTGNIDIINCIFMYNGDNTILHNSTGTTNLTNCLILVGGCVALECYGLTAYSSGHVNVTNCTFLGGMYGGIISNGATVNVKNCILWNIYEDAFSGTGFTVSYSCIQGGFPGTGNIDSNPLFVTGPNGDYYLSQIAAGQATNSPCVDTGSAQSMSLGMNAYTTRTDEVNDSGVVDMGYHYTLSSLEAYPVILQFEANHNGPNPAPQTITIRNSNEEPLNWTASVDANWLSIDVNSGTCPDVNDTNLITVSINIAGLHSGTYLGEIVISDLSARHNPRIVAVKLRVIGPVIKLNQDEFYFKVEQDVNNTVSQVLGIQNIGLETLYWQISENCNWLSLDPNFGSSTSEVDEVNIIVDVDGLPLGTNACEILVSSEEAENSPQIVTVQLEVVMPEFKLTASDGTYWDFFGYAVSISGDRCIVGALNDDENGIRSGSAYIFEWDGTKWIQQIKLTESDANSRHNFGCDVDIDGSRCIVGSCYESNSTYDNGFGYIFEWNGVSWVQTAKLKASDSNNYDAFGRIVSLSGNRCIVGAFEHQGDVHHSGAAYIFEFNGNEWIEQAKLLPTDGGMWHRFSLSLDISGNRCIVGTYDNQSIYIFEWDGVAWIQKAHLIGLGSGLDYDLVSIDGDRCIIGADLDESAYIFQWNGTAWIEQTLLTPPEGSRRFGGSVGIKDDRCIIGSYNAAYIFELNGTSWKETRLIPLDVADDDFFGYAVGISDDRYIVGSPYDDDNGENTGSAYIYQPYRKSDLDRNRFVDFHDFALFASQWLQQPGLPSADIAPPGGDGLVDYNDLAVLCQAWLDGY